MSIHLLVFDFEKYIVKTQVHKHTSPTSDTVDPQYSCQNQRLKCELTWILKYRSSTT